MSTAQVPSSDASIAAFHRFLLSDEVRLPGFLLPVNEAKGFSSSSDDETGGEDAADAGWETAADQDSFAESSFFPEIIGAISRVIADYKGSVFPKVDGFSPTDARWITCDHTLKCRSAGEVLLLLKSSDRVAEVLSKTTTSQQGHSKTQAQLVLKSWCNLTPSREFRCFVSKSRLVAAAQRSPVFFPHLSADAPQLKRTLTLFFDKAKMALFPLKSFVADVYVDKNMRVWLLDVHEYGASDPLLFRYGEPPLPPRDTRYATRTPSDNKRAPNATDAKATATGNTKFAESKLAATDSPIAPFELRIIESERETRPSFYVYDRLPKEKLMMDLTSKEAIERFAEAAREGKLQGQSNEDEESDDEEDRDSERGSNVGGHPAGQGGPGSEKPSLA